MIDRSRLRLVVLQVLVLSLLGTLGGRLWYLQVLSGADYDRYAANNRIRALVTPAPRGYLLDAQGVPLVQNEIKLVVSASRTEFRRMKPAKREEMIRKVADVLGEPFEAVWSRTQLCTDYTAKGKAAPDGCFNGSPLQPIPLSADADAQTALQIMERREEFPGITAELSPVRSYPKPGGAQGTHVFGYVGPVSDSDIAAQRKAQEAASGADEVELRKTDLIGKSGLEKQYDEYLRGTSGVQRLAVDKDGGVTGTVSETEPVPGAHVITSIDAKVQAKAEEQLLAAITRARTEGDVNKGGKKGKADAGAVVVMEVKTGRIVAMASYPTYDLGVWVGGIKPQDYAKVTGKENNYPMINRAIQGDFVAASTFKIVSLPAGVEAGYDLEAAYPCPGSFAGPGRSWANYESKPLGTIKLDEAIARSCDTLFYKWAYELYLRDGGRDPHKDAKDDFVNMALAFGLGKRSGIDLPSESTGRIVTRASKKERWERTKERSCQLAENGYKELEKTEPDKAAEFRRYAKENCLEGYIYKGADAINFAIGQGDTSVTPLQITRAYAAVGNDGKLMVPQVAKAVVAPDGRVLQEFAPKVERELPMAPKVVKYLQHSLELTTRPRELGGVGGTGNRPFRVANFPLDRIPVAAKTGTGEAGKDKDFTSWFASYAPANDPQYAVVMVVSQGGTGSGISGPSVAEIYKSLFGVDDEGTVDLSKAAVPGGRPPTTLPLVGAGKIDPPPAAPPLKLPAPAQPSASPSATSSTRRALGPRAVPAGGPA